MTSKLTRENYTAEEVKKLLRRQRSEIENSIRRLAKSHVYLDEFGWNKGLLAVLDIFENYND